MLSVPSRFGQVLRFGQSARARGPYELIVVAGAAVRRDGTASAALRRRVLLGAELYHIGLAPMVLVSGRGAGIRPEAEVMKEILVNAGVPPERIILESSSMTTEENALYTARLAPATRILVVSDQTHLFRCVRHFQEYYAVVDAVGSQSSWSVTLRAAAREAVIVAWRNIS